MMLSTILSMSNLIIILSVDAVLTFKWLALFMHLNANRNVCLLLMQANTRNKVL